MTAVVATGDVVAVAAGDRWEPVVVVGDAWECWGGWDRTHSGWLVAERDPHSHARAHHVAPPIRAYLVRGPQWVRGARGVLWHGWVRGAQPRWRPAVRANR